MRGVGLTYVVLCLRMESFVSAYCVTLRYRPIFVDLREGYIWCDLFSRCNLHFIFENVLCLKN